MMSYEEFKNYLMEALPYELPELLQERGLVMEPVEKMNGHLLDGIRFCNTGKDYESTPVIYAQDLYEDYQDGKPLAVIVKGAAGSLAHNAEKYDTRMNDLIQNGSVFFQLINTAKNQKLLADVPHRNLLDLSIIYRIYIGESESGMMSAIVNHTVAENILHKDEETLFAEAKENTAKILPLRVRKMKEVMMEIFLGCDLSEADEEAVKELSSIMPDDGMFVLTNTRDCNGAASILYQGALQDVADQTGSDLFILPSSIHEVIALPVAKDELGKDALAGIVGQVNRDPEAVREEQYLSGSVYRYDRETGNLSIVA